MRHRSALKEQVLADARKKMGMSDEKRTEFQQRMKEAKAKRMAKQEKKTASA